MRLFSQVRLFRYAEPAADKMELQVVGDLAALLEQEQGRLRGPATASTVLARHTVFGLAKPPFSDKRAGAGLWAAALAFELAPETEGHGAHFSEPVLLNLTLTVWHLAAQCSPPLLVSEFAAGVHHLTSYEPIHRFLFLVVGGPSGGSGRGRIRAACTVKIWCPTGGGLVLTRRRLPGVHLPARISVLSLGPG